MRRHVPANAAELSEAAKDKDRAEDSRVKEIIRQRIGTAVTSAGFTPYGRIVTMLARERGEAIVILNCTISLEGL